MNYEDPLNKQEKRWAWLFILALVAAILVSPLIESAEAASTRPHPRIVKKRKAIICAVFGWKHCGAAIRVADCESSFDIKASNGIYKGMFQVSPAWRRRFWNLWGYGAWAQARHARAIFRSGGYSWHPWECRP